MSSSTCHVSFPAGRAQSEGRVFIPPFDDPRIIAGAGTVGDEIMRQCHDWDDLHAVFVPVGGGGLTAGVAAYIKVWRRHGALFLLF